MTITIEKKLHFNQEKITVGVIENRNSYKMEFNYLVIDGKVKVMQTPKK